MGYIFTVFVLIAGLMKGFCGKKISGEVSTERQRDGSIVSQVETVQE